LYVVVLSRATAADPFTAVTDNVGNTWERITYAPVSGTVGRRIEMWQCELASPFSTITISFTGSGQAQATLVEISGHATDGDPVDAFNAGFSSGTTTPPSITVTPSVSGALVLGALQANSNTDSQITASSGWTRLSTNSQGPSLAYRVDTTEGVAVGVSWTQTASVGSGQAIIAVLPGEDGPPPEGLTVTVWNGSSEVPAVIEGVWNGTSVVAVDSISVA